MRYLLLLSAVLFLCQCSSSDKTKPDPDIQVEDTAGEVTEDVVTDLSPELEPETEIEAEVTPDVPDEVEQPKYPDPTFFHKAEAEPLAKATDEYIMDQPVQYRVLGALESPSVTCLSVAGEQLWVGTGLGLYRHDSDTDSFSEFALGEGDPAAIVDIAESLDNSLRLGVATASAIYLVNTETADNTIIPMPDVVISTIAVDGDNLWIGTTEHGVWYADTGEEFPTTAALYIDEDFAVRDILIDMGGNAWFATAMGIRRYNGGDSHLFSENGGFLPDNDVRALAFHEPTNSVIAGTQLGISRIDGDKGSLLLAGIGGLPTADITALAFQNGTLAVGHTIGASALAESWLDETPFAKIDHYISGRWMPDNSVRDVAIDADGSIWLGTGKGLSRIEWVARDFAEKAAKHEELLNAHFWRMDGFVSSEAHMDDIWEPTEWTVNDKDNDGLWTQMQIGAWCYAYAATGDEQYYERARKAIDVMMMQVDIPAVDFEAAGMKRGFVTRSLVRDDETVLWEDKLPQDNWHEVEWTDGHSYQWKDDTSSDEIDGHFYGYPLFYDLCAKTDEERAEVASYAQAIADYIIEGGYVLIDLGGEKTSHGHWSPETIGAAAGGIDECLAAADELEDIGEKFAAVEKCYESHSGGGWLNSTEIIGTLLATYHMTGDPKYYDEYELLLLEYQYENLIIPHAETMTVTEPSIMNHSDHELAMLAYHTLIRYEPNDDRRAKWIDGMMFMYEWELVERNPLWAAFITLLAGPEKADLEPALASLREMPDDRREWMVDNSHRKDSADWPDDRFDDPQFEGVFPYDEIRTVWWNGNLHEKVYGGNPKEVSGPMAWLLPYWAFRYAGVISE
jgi:hypothetical protein